MGIVATILAGIGSKLAADEIRSSFSALRDFFFRRAVSRLPSDLRARYEEEWAADLLCYPGEIASTIRAFGLYRAASWIRRQDAISKSIRRTQARKSKSELSKDQIDDAYAGSIVGSPIGAAAGLFATLGSRPIYVWIGVVSGFAIFAFGLPFLLFTIHRIAAKCPISEEEV